MRNLISNNENIEVSYSIFTKNQKKLESFCDNKLQIPEIGFIDYEDDLFEYVEDEGVEKAEKLDYIIAAASGVVTGLLDVFWVGEFSLKNAKSWGDEEAKKIVIKSARAVGYQKKDLLGAISYLESKFPMPSDGATTDFGGGLQHHLRDFSHHPTIVGLIFSILNQFTGKAYGTDKKGNFIFTSINNPKGIGTDFASKIFKGTIHWVFHLISDMAGSSSTPGKGVGIPGPMISYLKELSSLPFIKEINIKYKGDCIGLSQWISKLFNGNFFTGNVNRLKDRDRFDLRFEMGIAKEIGKQSVPVIINECIVRGFYSINRLFREIGIKGINSLSDIEKLDPDKFLPFNSRALTRMITISSGTFLITDFAGAAIKSGIDNYFLLHINFVGIGRFAFSLKSDAGYIAEDIKEAYDDFMRNHNKEFCERKLFETGLEDLILNNKKTKLLYSLKQQMILYDISKTKTKSGIALKEKWLKDWMIAASESLKVEISDLFANDEKATYHQLHSEIVINKSNNWLLLIVLEMIYFNPYYPLNIEEVKEYKNLKYRSNYLLDRFATMQYIMDKKYLKSIIKTFNTSQGILTNSKVKNRYGLAGTAVVTVGAGILAFTFAPQIAVIFAGSSLAGLSGAALTSASLALIGGGSLAVGGLGMAGGTAIIAGGGAIIGTISSSAISSVMLMSSKNYSLQEATKLLTYCNLILKDKPELVKKLQIGAEKQISIMNEELERLEKIENNDKDIKMFIKESKASVKYLERLSENITKMLEDVDDK